MTVKQTRGPKITTGGALPRVKKDLGTVNARVVAVPPGVAGRDPYEKIDGLPLQKLRTSFRPEEFQRVIRQHGYHSTWRKAMVCPCLRETTNQASINCVHCDGSSWFYHDAMRLRAVMTRFSRDTKSYEKFGSIIEGTAQITVEAQYRIHHMDQIEMSDAIMSFSEVITKGNRRGARAVLPDGQDCARYRIVNLTRAVVLNDDNEIRLLEQGVHFDINKNGWIEWLSGAGDDVEDEQNVSLLYEYHPIYIVMSHPNAVRDAIKQKKVPMPEVVSMPIQATIKLDYVMDIATPLPSLQQRVDSSSEIDDPEPL